MPKHKANQINTLFRFIVEGTMEFPFDMLRYDRCWPTYETEIVNIAPFSRERQREQRSISMTGLQEPTDARWTSFGWRVRDVQVMRQG